MGGKTIICYNFTTQYIFHIFRIIFSLFGKRGLENRLGFHMFATQSWNHAIDIGLELLQKICQDNDYKTKSNRC